MWTTRAGAERDLTEELALLGTAARPLQDGLVLSAPPPAGAEPAFARQGLPVAALCAPEVEAVAAALRPLLRRPYALHLFSPDSEAGNALCGLVRGLQGPLTARLDRDGGPPRLDSGVAARAAGGQLAQVCLMSDKQVAVGVVPAVSAHSLAPGGRLRVRQGGPARSARKLAEALLWLGRGPERGDLCVDLGAAPGGWTRVALARGARVIAVDPGRLAPSLRAERRVRYVPYSAFDFVPEEPADWLLCDMAWRPLEVAALLARWGRRRWARFLIANIKLPMRQRAAMLARVKEILATGGWVDVRARQLYHDRDEVTVAAWRGFGVDARPPQRRAGRDG
ncbi:MAG: 23S rRNA (cytidine(2498)-2'-O)-methyltransferase RlmM [Myxococcota bacterium]|nr:23S rRNA (cytidine(2498)-2'-O)-methyltransferase RlmM [Myxococcota bacterium]